MRLACLLLLIPQFAFSQTFPTAANPKPNGIVYYKRLSIGDELPPLVLDSTRNYPSSSVNLGDFKEKILVLDLFSTGCTVCIAEIPHLQQMQEKYSDKMQLFLVTKEPGLALEKTKAKVLRQTTLPVIYSASIITRLFPYQSLPHQVWLYHNKVIAITGGRQITTQNIETVLATGSISLPFKNDVVYTHEKPLLIDGNGGADSALLARYTIGRYMPGVSTRHGQFYLTGNALKRYFYLNMSPLELYQAAMGKAYFNRIIIETRNKKKYYQTAEVDVETWKQDHAYSIELTLPASYDKMKVQKTLLSELDHSFGLESRFEKRMVPCLAIRDVNPKIELLKGKNDPTEMVLDPPGKTSTKLFNAKISNLAELLNAQPVEGGPHRLFISESAINFPVNVRITADVKDLSLLRSQLNQYGFDLVEVKRQMEVLVITETNNK